MDKFDIRKDRGTDRIKGLAACYATTGEAGEAELEKRVRSQEQKVRSPRSGYGERPMD